MSIVESGLRVVTWGMVWMLLYYAVELFLPPNPAPQDLLLIGCVSALIVLFLPKILLFMIRRT